MLLTELRHTPIPVNTAVVDGAYAVDRGPFWRDVIPNIEVDRQDPRHTEPLAGCAASGLLIRNYYKVTKALDRSAEAAQYISDDIWLRSSIVADLRLLDEAIASYNIRLIVMSGYRHPELQRLVRETARAERGDDFVNKMFSDPSVYSPHATGGALDIELWDNARECVLPTKWKGGIDRHALERTVDLTPEAILVRANRRLCHHLLATDAVLPPGSALIPHPFEYWHYGRHERLSAFFENEAGRDHVVYYDTVMAYA